MSDNSLSILKKAFNEGFEAFQVYPIPNNPYQKDSLPSKEWIRGYNRGYFEAKKKAVI